MQYPALYPLQAATNDARVGAVDWSVLGNILAQDGTVVSCAVNNQTSHFLKIQNFGFNLRSDAVIYGFQIEVLRNSTAGTGIFVTVKLIKDNVIQGTNLANNETMTVNPAYQSYGGVTQLVGMAWNAAEVNSANFGVAISCSAPGVDQLNIDTVRITAFATGPHDLITQARAYQNLAGISNDTLIQALITSASDAIRKWCRRDFVVTNYDELYSGNGERTLLLREYPIQQVKSVRYRPVTVLKIQNTDQATNQQARAQVTSSGITLTRMASGTLTTNTLTYASNTTLQSMATAIAALGNGWTAQVVGDPNGDYGLWPSSDLWVQPSFGDGLSSQGNLTARGQNAELKMHTYELAGYQFDPRGWLLRAIPYSDPELQHPEDLVWPTGINNFRIQYAAGYTTIPEAIQEACAEWVANLYYPTQRDVGLVNTLSAAGAASMWKPVPGPVGEPPDTVLTLLKPYKRHVV